MAAIAAATFSAVAGRTPGRPLRTRSTVASDTPASRATSCTVARRSIGLSFKRFPLPFGPRLGGSQERRQHFPDVSSEEVVCGEGEDGYHLTRFPRKERPVAISTETFGE